MKMNKILRLTFSLCFIALTSQSTTTYAAKKGGVNGGGGNDIESLYKARTIEITEHLATLPENFKSMLRFNAEYLYADAISENSFFVKCLSEDQSEKLEVLRKENKKAYVFNDDIKTVTLNCSDYTIDDWKKFTDHSNPGNAIFLLHEILRTTDTVNEDSYYYSKDYIKVYFALKKENDDVRKNVDKKFDQMILKQDGAKDLKCYFESKSIFNITKLNDVELKFIERKSGTIILKRLVSQTWRYNDNDILNFINNYQYDNYSRQDIREQLKEEFIRFKCYENN